MHPVSQLIAEQKKLIYIYDNVQKDDSRVIYTSVYFIQTSIVVAFLFLVSCFWSAGHECVTCINSVFSMQP